MISCQLTSKLPTCSHHCHVGINICRWQSSGIFYHRMTNKIWQGQSHLSKTRIRFHELRLTRIPAFKFYSKQINWFILNSVSLELSVWERLDSACRARRLKHMQKWVNALSTFSEVSEGYLNIIVYIYSKKENF